MSAPDPSASPAAREAPAPPPVSLEERKAERAKRRAAAAFIAMASETPGQGGQVPAAQPAPASSVPALSRPAASLPAPSVAPAPAVVPPATPPRGPRPAPPAAARPRAAAVPARARGRHWLVATTFALLVVLPTALCAWYMWTRAAPRYASTAGFSVRTEDVSSAVELLGGMASLAGGSSSPDTDILYQFIQSQEIAALVDARLDLRELWSRPGGDWRTGDPVFAYVPGREGPNGERGTIEDLHAYWKRMVAVYTSPGTGGLLNVEVQAFTPEDAQAIAQAIYEESGILVNRLSDIAQADATRYAEEELATNVERLKEARAALTRFRNETQIVDPAASMQSQMGILSSLESELATQFIELDLLRQTAPEADPRITQAEARIAVIEARIDAEREKVGLGQPGGGPGGEGGADGAAYADLVGQYEGLFVDQEFAQQSYVAALAAYDAALAESRRQSRYLAAHVQPTRPESPTHPKRVMLVALMALFAALAWSIATLAAYAIRDRR